MNALEVLAGQQPAVAAHVPGDVAGVGHDLRVGRLGDEAALRFVEVALSANGNSALTPLRSSSVNFDGGLPSGSKCFATLAPWSAGIREAPGVLARAAAGAVCAVPWVLKTPVQLMSVAANAATMASATIP